MFCPDVTSELVSEAGFEPARSLRALPPQDSASASSATPTLLGGTIKILLKAQLNFNRNQGNKD